ncbi:MAG: response regulator transcription factor [Firmicutes bacterium]|nr:response regulator transcription factor [Bacillota bacterium]
MRLIIKKIIDKQENFKLVGEAENGKVALKLVEDYNPDVIFLDIEMPEVSGIECAKKIVDINPKASIIFATAHEQFMSDAFELYAFDYLIKPFKIDRVYKTLRKIKNLNLEKEYDIRNIRESSEKSVEKLIIKNKEGMNFIDKDDIVLVQRENRSTVIYTLNNRYVTSEGLGHLEERLEERIFFRSHRSYIINISKINKIEPYGRWTYIVKFKGTDMDALITHEKYEELENIIVGS